MGTISALGQQLLFDAEDVPAIRAKLSQAPYAEMMAAIASRLDPAAGNDPALSDNARIGQRATEARNAATMFVLTGEAIYADRAQEMALAVIGEGAFWGVDSANGLRRSEMAAAVAQAYDFAGGAWDPATRAAVAGELVRNADSLMRSGGSGWPGDNAPANNWHGVRWSSALLSYLAVGGTEHDASITTAYDRLVTHFEANLAGNTEHRDDGLGWNPEGIGYTQWPSNRSWGQAAVAMQRLRGRDLLADGPPGLKYTLWSAYVGAVPIATSAGRVGLIPDFADDGNSLTGRGLGNLAFRFSPPQLLPGLRWQYDRLWGSLGDGTYDTDDGAGMWGLLFYPNEVQPQNPAEVWGLHYVDEHFAIAMFRDRYQDENDLVAMHSARWRNANDILENTHWGPDVNGLRLLGLNTVWATSGRNDARNQTSVMPIDPELIGGINPDRQIGSVGFGSLEEYYTHEADGSGYTVVTGTDMGDSNSPAPLGTIDHTRRFAVDYDAETSGARGIFIVADTSLNGNFWRWNTGGMNDLEIDPSGGHFTITSPDGHRLIGHVLHGDASTMRSGTADRNRAIAYRGTSVTTNHWVDLQDAGDGSFVVLLQMIESGQEPVPLDVTGTGMDQTIRVGRQIYHVSEHRIWAETWNQWTAGDGTFSQAENWRFAVPEGPGAWATFEASSPLQVDVDTASTLGNLRFDGTARTTLTGLATLTLAASDGLATIEVGPAPATIAAPLAIDHVTHLAVDAGASLELAGPLSANAPLLKSGSGSLIITLDDPRQLNVGTTFALLDGTIALDGTYAGAVSLSLIDPTEVAAELGQVGIDIGDELTVYRLTANGLVGDYNGDGVVNLADYTVWRDHLGGPPGSLENDPVGGAIGAAQYVAWRENFGNRLPAGLSAAELASLPEPWSGLMLALGVLHLYSLTCQIRIVEPLKFSDRSRLP